ncbi:MAG TPA: hypothetical protein VFF73_12845 [Planctomycetota bacterium]|nr:hypothetical protein [Planctomycetota bacterium]
MGLADQDERYAEVTVAMERAFESVRDNFPELTADELLLALLLLKDRILEQHLDSAELSPAMAPLARRLYEL